MRRGRDEKMMRMENRGRGNKGNILEEGIGTERKRKSNTVKYRNRGMTKLKNVEQRKGERKITVRIQNENGREREKEKWNRKGESKCKNETEERKF